MFSLIFYVFFSGSIRSKKKYDVVIGTRTFMLENSVVVSDDVEQIAQTHEENGRTAVLVAINSKLNKQMPCYQATSISFRQFFL